MTISTCSIEASNRKPVPPSKSSGKSDGIFGFAYNLVYSLLSGSNDIEPSYGRLFQHERNLQAKFKEMEEKIILKEKEMESAFTERKPIKFPEATAFSSTFIRNIGGQLEFWMDSVESKKMREGSSKISKHILWSRPRYFNTKSLTTYFIYRPSFEAQLESKSILPHLKYHEEAQETFAAVNEKIQENPNDQIIFVGLQSGGAIAMLHAWMAISSNPILLKNIKQFKGELHQIKILLFDSDCVLSQTNAMNFPIPSWDILRFYSGYDNLNPNLCKFESMAPVGLAYPYEPTYFEYIFPSRDSVEITRRQFVEYYMDDQKLSTEEQEAIDYGIEEAFDDSESVAPSEISMSDDGRGRSASISISNDHRKQQTPKENIQIPSIEEKIKPGIELLKSSVQISQFFYKNLKNIYLRHRKHYLQRNVEGCSIAMEKNLKSTLMGFENDSPLVPRGIRDISCSVRHYDEISKEALIVCNLIGIDSVSSSILQFSTHLQNDTEKILTDNQIPVNDGEYEELSSVSSESRDRSKSDQSKYTRQESYGNGEGLYFDDITHVTGFQEKAEMWSNCLEDLFKEVEHLNFINPLGHHHESARSIETSGPIAPGSSVLAITLPYSSTLANCEYSFLTKAKNYFQLYSVSSSMFYSIFSSVIETRSMPQVCTNILEPPTIPYSELGSAKLYAQVLNEYFNTDGSENINYGNTIFNGLEIEQSTSNLPNNNPYAIFSSKMGNKLAECLAQNVLDKLYNCNSPLTRWAGRHHCPDICLNRPGLHLCSRVVDCGDGVYLGFRGCKSLGKEKDLSEDFGYYSMMNSLNIPSYFSAFHMKFVDGWTSFTRKPFRYSIFMNESAKKSFLSLKEEGELSPISTAVALSSENSISSLKQKNILKEHERDREINLNLEQRFKHDHFQLDTEDEREYSGGYYTNHGEGGHEQEEEEFEAYDESDSEEEEEDIQHFDMEIGLDSTSQIEPENIEIGFNSNIQQQENIEEDSKTEILETQPIHEIVNAESVIPILDQSSVATPAISISSKPDESKSKSSQKKEKKKRT